MATAIVFARLGGGVGIGFLQVDHQQTDGFAHLHGGEADAGGIVHRLEHVGDERAQIIVERLDGCGHLLEHRMRCFENGADRHSGQIIVCRPAIKRPVFDHPVRDNRLYCANCVSTQWP